MTNIQKLIQKLTDAGLIQKTITGQPRIIQKYKEYIIFPTNDIIQGVLLTILKEKGYEAYECEYETLLTTKQGIIIYTEHDEYTTKIKQKINKILEGI